MAASVEEQVIPVSVQLSAEEVSQRVAILIRFRELLQAQRDRFRQYLESLDKQKDVIEADGSAEALTAQVDLEERIVADIFAIQKVIDPLEIMYRESKPAGESSESATEIPNLKSALAELKTEAAARSERNKKLLAERMVELRREIKESQTNPYAHRRSIYAGEEVPSLLDING